MATPSAISIPCAIPQDLPHDTLDNPVKAKQICIRGTGALMENIEIRIQTRDWSAGHTGVSAPRVTHFRSECQTLAS